MNNIVIKNISRRTPGTNGYSHLLFTDETGCVRLGRILPFPVDTCFLKSIWKKASAAGGILVPDAVTILQDGTGCISVRLEDLSPAECCFSLREMVEPLRELASLNLNHLSIDSSSYVADREKNLKLIFWGDGLLRVHPSAPPEVRAGGFPGIVSDLFMVSAGALEKRWLKDEADVLQAETLTGSNYPGRCSEAKQLGFICQEPSGVFDLEDYFSFSVLTGGDWRERDAEVNSILAEATARGWACRAIRKAAGEAGRPLPDIPAGTVTTSPEELLENAFHNRPGIEKLLVISDLSKKQEDLVFLLNKLRKFIPSGLHILVVSDEDALFPDEPRTVLDGAVSAALDLPLGAIGKTGKFCCTGPSWYGPRLRTDSFRIEGIDKPFFEDETLFREGAWLRTVSMAGGEHSSAKAESLLMLGRFPEALRCVPEENRELRAEILMGLGNYQEASEILTDRSEPLRRARALRGTGRIKEALEILRVTRSSEHLPELAELYDLSGNPAAGLSPLLEGLQHAEGTERVDILCALRNLEMRLGLYSDALAHSEMALELSRETSGISQLVNALQARGRTLLVLGRWKEAGEDFETAVHIHDENALLSMRPPHIDLIDLELRMGRISHAENTLKTLKRIIHESSVPSEQMLLMLTANMGALLGDGKEGIPIALRAEELASSHGMELYSGISTLYAGKMYLQAGMRKRGTALLRKARASGHMLGDRHLVCLADIELFLAQDRDGEIQEGEYTGGKELSEEYLIACIIRGTDTEASFMKLLELPSPLTACRLADACGFPDSEELRERIINARNKIAGQLTPGKREKYLSLFSRSWSRTDSDEELSRNEREEKLQIVSGWIFDYSEGLKNIDSLKEELGLSDISLEKKPSMVRVPGRTQLFISGKRARAIAPLLAPAAAVLACIPERNSHPTISGRSGDILGDSPAMQKVRYEIERYAREDISILITGETGTGKEVCARTIHRLSEKTKGTFVPVDCGAIPENLMESEFFGAAPGAYTGITAHRTGLLQEADLGTLFLDEIGNLPLHMQAKLLRVLDNGVFRKLGENRERKVDLRIIAATSSDLRELTAKGLFRSDLYYRLAVVEIHLPPLRERITDLELLARHFTGLEISPGALSLLMNREWQGNVRELQNVVRRAAISARNGIIKSCDVTPEKHVGIMQEEMTLHDVIRAHIVKTVESAGGNRSEAARILNCDPKTVRKYVKG